MKPMKPMLPIHRLLTVLSLLSVLLVGVASPPATNSWQAKVDPWVLQAASAGDAQFLVYLSAQADLSMADALPTRLQKGQYVFETLTSFAQNSQKPLVARLEQLGVTYRPYWIANMLLVQGSLDTLQMLASLPEVKHIYANPSVTIEAPIQVPASTAAIQAIGWNLYRVGAPDLWAEGITGQGVVVGAQDTGFIWDTPTLKGKYRGWNGSVVNHDYNWYDATDTHSLVPVDPYGHGTPVMGAIVGDDGAGHQIGVAPGARWIGCRNMDRYGHGTPATYAACYQWFVAPTRVDGSSPRPDLAPDVINNSWSCLPTEGCTDPGVLLTVVRNLRLAGIVTVHSAGNNGRSGCETITQPAAIYAESFTVGATDSGDVLADFSGKGPVTVDGSGRLKPDISAPGVDVLSCTTDGGYSLMTGTSIASPHITGAVALLLSAYPELRGHVDQVELILDQSAHHVSSTDCSSSGIPNNLYGWGRVNALDAYHEAQQLQINKRASILAGEPGSVITYTITITPSYITHTSVILTDTLPAHSSFISANPPYDSQLGDTFYWDFTVLHGQESAIVEFVVQSDPSFIGKLVNNDYAVQSDQVAWMRGIPVSTYLGPVYFLPLTLLNH